jgi:hypothetical protein
MVGGNFEMKRKSIDREIGDLNKPYDDYEWTDLHFIASTGSPCLFTDWLNRRGSLDNLYELFDARDDILFYTPLMIAIDSWEVNEDELEGLHSGRISIECSERDCSLEQRTELIWLMLECRADPNAEDHITGMNALKCAASVDYFDALQALVHFGGNIHRKDSFGKTALQYSIEFYALRSFRELISLGADVNQRFSVYVNGRTVEITSLHFALELDDVIVKDVMVTDLLAANANTYTKAYGMCTLAYARSLGDLNSANKIIKWRLKGLHTILKYFKWCHSKFYPYLDQLYHSIRAYL